MIVLANQDGRQVQQRRDVKSLKELPLIRSPISIHGERDRAILGILLAERDATPKRDLSPNDTMAAIELRLLLVEMHRPALALRATTAAAHQLRKTLKQRSTAGEKDAMITVSRDNRVPAGDGGLHADADGFLTIVEVAKPTNKLRFVERVSSDLHAAHHGHISEETEEFLWGCLDGA